MLNIPLRSYFLKLCHWTDIEGYVIVIFLCFTEMLLPCSCDYFYLVIAKIKIIHFWICLQASNNCQHAPGYILQMGFFFLKYFQDFFQVKKVIIMSLSEWWWFLSQCGLPAWELCPGMKSRGEMLTLQSLFPSPYFSTQIARTFGYGFFFNCNTTTMKSEVFNPIYSSTFLPISVFFSAHFIQINKQGKSGMFGSHIFSYCVECYINTIIWRHTQNGFLFRLNNVTLTQ